MITSTRSIRSVCALVSALLAGAAFYSGVARGRSPIRVESARGGALVDPYKALRRHLHIPHYKAGSPCPESDIRPSADYDPARGRPGQPPEAVGGYVIGRGPVFPIVTNKDGTLYMSDTRTYGTWYLFKVLWIAAPQYDGPVLVRGRQVDGRHRIRFGLGASPSGEFQFRSRYSFEASGWRQRSSAVRIDAPGCFAFQIDGRAFSNVIFFTVRKTRP